MKTVQIQVSNPHSLGKQSRYEFEGDGNRRRSARLVVYTEMSWEGSLE